MLLDIPENAYKALVEKYDVPGPFYTSYPAVSCWTGDFKNAKYREALIEVFSKEPNQPVSLYVHFPFCEKLCYYCCCTASITKNRDKIRHFLEYLMKELRMFSEFLKAHDIRLAIKELHLGGGSPSYMEKDEIKELVDVIKTFAPIENLSEFIIEIDVRNVDADKMRFYQTLGVNRISLGIQDFDPVVQEKVNRVQPLELVREMLAPEIRSLYPSLNFDLIYGLPRQTRASFRDTVEKVAEFMPDRVSVYSYGHKPSVFKHMEMIKESDLPDIFQKAMINLDATERLLALGYEKIGIDHFALKKDVLAKAKNDKTLNRLFNGYTPGRTRHLLGFGPASTSSFGEFYSQNRYSHEEYFAELDSGEFPIFRGFKLSDDDVIRRDVINRILTVSQVNIPEIEEKYGIKFSEYFSDAYFSLAEMASDGLIKVTWDMITVTELGTYFFRNICIPFDKYRGLNNSSQYPMIRIKN